MSRLAAVLIALLLALTALPAPPAFADWPAWSMDQQPVPYCVNPARIPIGSSGGPIMSADDLVARVQTAFGAWMAVPGANIKLSYTGLCDNDPADHNDGVNAVGYAKLGNTSNGSAVGKIEPTYVHGSAARQTASRLIEVDLMLDTRYAQSFDDMSHYVDVVLPNVLLHETGHFLGLQHTKTACSIMRPFIDDVVGGLCDYDRDQLRSLYPGS